MVVHARGLAVLFAVTLTSIACTPASPPTESESTPAAEASTVAEDEALAVREADLAAREAEVAAQAEQLEREKEAARREAELAAREASLARRERELQQAAATPPPPPTPSAPTPPIASPAPEATSSDPVRVAEADSVPEPRVPEKLRYVAVAGTPLEVEFQDSLSSATSRVGEPFTARVASAVRVDGEVVVPEGAEVLGTVVEAVPLKRVGGRARLGLEFEDLRLPGGTSVPISATFQETGTSETGRDAATIGGAAAGGAVLGRATAKKKDRDKATVIGAILGAAAGTVIAAKTEGREVVIEAGTFLTLILDKDLEIVLER